MPTAGFKAGSRVVVVVGGYHWRLASLAAARMLDLSSPARD